MPQLLYEGVEQEERDSQITIGIFTTVTNPERRGDCHKPALTCYAEFADVLTVIDGADTWPQEFSWELIGQHFEKGYQATDSDWVLHMDLDFIIHEDDYNGVRQALTAYNDEKALSFWKYQFILPDRYNLKSRLVIAVNKTKFGDGIHFDSGGDECQPSYYGQEIKPDSVPEARIAFWNYEKLTKTKDQIVDDVERMDRAYHRRFGKWLYSNNGVGAYEGWYHMAKGRFSKPQQPVRLEDHPKVMQDIIKNLTPDQFGYNGFGLIEGKIYA